MIDKPGPVNAGRYRPQDFMLDPESGITVTGNKEKGGKFPNLKGPEQPASRMPRSTGKMHQK